MARVDLELILAEISGEDLIIEEPENVLRHVVADHIVTHPSSPAFELVLIDRGRAIAFVQSAGRTQVGEWYPITNVSTRAEVNTLRQRLERAACRYLEIEEHGTEMILAGLADGAGNGLGACMLYRTLIGGGGTEEEEGEDVLEAETSAPGPQTSGRWEGRSRSSRGSRMRPS